MFDPQLNTILSFRKSLKYLCSASSFMKTLHYSSLNFIYVEDQ